MRLLLLQIMLIGNILYASSQVNAVNQLEIKEDLNKIVNDISRQYIYLEEKNIDLNCIREYYEKEIPTIKTAEEKVLFFEYLLDEFYDSHLILNTNTNSSFRLFSPVYASIENKKTVISNVWSTQIEQLEHNIIGAEILKINGINLNKAIDQFPTHCNNKEDLNIKEWIVNKLLAGRYNQPRVLRLKLRTKETIEFDLDKTKIKQSSNLLNTEIKNEIGIIRLNNSLGNNDLIKEFDIAIDKLMQTKGLILDLRNTVDGGNSYVARGIMGRFITSPKPYQKHIIFEQYGDGPKIERSWTEYVSPRAAIYSKPVVILVGRWTGSMGEGLAIGFEGMERGHIVGSEMERLAGGMNGFSFKHQGFGFRLSTEKIFHVNGIPREKYIPTFYVKQTSIEKDETLEKGIQLINKLIK